MHWNQVTRFLCTSDPKGYQENRWTCYEKSIPARKQPNYQSQCNFKNGVSAASPRTLGDRGGCPPFLQFGHFGQFPPLPLKAQPFKIRPWLQGFTLSAG